MHGIGIIKEEKAGMLERLADPGMIEHMLVNLISLDYLLPGEITGRNVYNYIRKKSKEIPILSISGNIEFLESIRELKKNDPYVDHLSKPCKKVDYLSAINRLMSRVER